MANNSLKNENEGFIMTEAEEEVNPKRENKKIDFKKFKTPAIIVASVLLVIALFFGIMHFVSAPWRKGEKPMPEFFAKIGMYQGPAFRYFDGITINGVDVGGMTKNQANKAVLAAQDGDKSAYSIKITARDKSYQLDGKDIVFSIDTDDALNNAKKYCVSIMRGETVFDYAQTAFKVDVNIDTEKMANVITAIQTGLKQDPVNATFKGVKASGVEFEEEKDGINITLENIKNDIETFIASGQKRGEIIATNDPIKAEITVAKLKEKIQIIGTFSTTSTASSASTFNMKKAMGLCDGSVIEPGAVWSFNTCTGNSNLASGGWVPAKVISGGQFTNGYGGGICQASTTIYNAALRANLTIDTRYNHTYPSTYCKVGFDATVDYPNKDLKLKNDTGYPVYIQCTMEGKKLVVNIYGCPDNTFDDITFESSTIKRVPGSYYDVASYRILWKDGKVIKREQLITSRYSLKDPNGSSSNSSSSEGSSSEGSSSEGSSSEGNSSTGSNSTGSSSTGSSSTGSSSTGSSSTGSSSTGSSSVGTNSGETPVPPPVTSNPEETQSPENTPTPENTTQQAA